MSSPNACILCGSPHRRPVARYATPDRYERAVGIGVEGYWREWVVCLECGFHYSRYSRTPAVLDALYSEGYRSATAEWRAEDALTRFRRIVTLSPEESETHARICWIKQVLGDAAMRWNDPGERRMLDVGGASGVFAALFQDDHWRSTVVDPSREGRFIESELGIPYIEGAFEDVTLDQAYHLVALNYVLEHVVDPAGMLRRAALALDVAGMVYIEVPHAVNFDIWPPEDDVFNACHLWMFDEDSLTRLFDDAGLSLLAHTVTQVRRGHVALMALAKAA